MMPVTVAHIAWTKLPEFRLKRLVCTVGDEARYMADSWTDDIIEVKTGCVFRATSPEAEKNWGRYPLVYGIPGGPLRIGRNQHEGSYDGHAMREEWPSSKQRRLVFGPHVFEVDAYDDSLRFQWTDTADDLRRVIIGFRCLGGFDRNSPG